jgi:hypothetical protein
MTSSIIENPAKKDGEALLLRRPVGLSLTLQ